MSAILIISLLLLGYLYLGLSKLFIIYVFVVLSVVFLMFIKCKTLYVEMNTFSLHAEIFNNIFLNSNKYSKRIDKFFLKQGLAFQAIKDNHQYDELMRLMKNRYDLVYWRLLKKQNGNTKYMFNCINNYYSHKYQFIKSSVNECLIFSISLSVMFILFSFVYEFDGSDLLLLSILLLFVLLIAASVFFVIRKEIIIDKKVIAEDDIISLYILTYNLGLKEAIEELEISEQQLNDKKYFKLIGFLDDIKKNNSMVGNLILEETLNNNYPREKLDISYMFYFSISIFLFLLSFGG